MPAKPVEPPAAGADTPEYKAGRRAMVRTIESEAEMAGSRTGRPQLSRRVIEAISQVPRHAFVPEDLRAAAYDDRPLPIGHRQTISQPYIVALVTDLLDLAPDARVLEVGTGSGYQAAVLAEVAADVFTVEWVPELAAAAKKRLARLGYGNVRVRQGDGAQGWPENAPFDGILLSCAAVEFPEALIQQLAPGGRLVAPVGSRGYGQVLTVLEMEASGEVSRRPILPVAFVPLLGGSGD